MPRERRLFTEGYRKMKLEAVSGMMLTLLLIGMLSASFEIREASASPTVRIYVEMPPQGYIPGIPVGQTLKVAVNIESPPEWRDTVGGIVGWGFYVHVDPDVLEPITVESATSGHFLYDFANKHGYSTSILFLTDKEAGLFEDVAEFIMGYEGLGVGAGGDGKLCELWFKSKSETAHTLIDLIDVRYWTVLSGGWLPADVVIDGHYNARTFWNWSKKISRTTGESWAGDAHSVAVWENNVYIVWSEDVGGGNFEIFFRRSRDGGTTWDNKKKISRTTGYSMEPAIAVYVSDVHVVWADNQPGHYEIFYRRSRDGGTTWDPKKKLSRTSGGDAVNPDIAVADTQVHVVWSGCRGYTGPYENPEIYYRRSLDGGTVWERRKRLSRSLFTSVSPSIDAQSDLVDVAWSDRGPDPTGNFRVFNRISLAAGASWERKKRVSWSSEDETNPSVALWESHVHIAWEGKNGEIWYRRSDNYGRDSWTRPKRISWTPGQSGGPSIDVHGAETVHLVWYGDTAKGTDYEIFYRQSLDGGDSWLPKKRLTWDAEESVFPSIAVWGTTSATIHVVWQSGDLTLPGNDEIYYRRGHWIT